MTLLRKVTSSTVRRRANSVDPALLRFLFRLGILDTKIVGVQYYTGHATPGEHVIVRREPQNPYDTNALRVENVQRDQIGHIPRAMASKLAKYMVRLSTSPVSDILTVASGFWSFVGGGVSFRSRGHLRLSHCLEAVRI